MKIEIKHRITGSIIVSGDYENTKDCLEKNGGADLRDADLRGADLGGADLGGAYLRGADLGDADLRGAYLRGAYLEGAYLRGADLRGADLRGADLGDADLRGADLRGADLRDADLRGADLRGADLRDADLRDANLGGAYLEDAKNYRDSHDIFAEAVRREKVSVFTDAEWSTIAQITIHRLCWDSIKNRFPGVIPHIFEVLAESGFTEWLEYWNSSAPKGEGE